MSGHSKWATIRHRKGAQDAKKGRVFTKVAKELTVAARLGGADPSSNPRLRLALTLAKGANMPSDNVEKAIKKGTGELEGISYEEIMYEGVGAGGVLILIETVTDNRNRTAAEFRNIFDKHNAQLGAAGTAAWAFEQKGVIVISNATETQAFDPAIEAGAEDITEDGDDVYVTTPRNDLDQVTKTLQKNFNVREAKLHMLPKLTKPVPKEHEESLSSLLDILEDHDDVQNVYTDVGESEP